MELIAITKENLEREHICCAISSNTDCQVLSKKAWLAQRLDDGLVFLKGDVRGKCFIEYIPAERAWAPVEADGYMYIDCFWVSGQFKGQGNANLLLDACIRDSRAKGKAGLAVLSSKKKQPFLSDPQFLKYKGFAVADTAGPFYELLYLPFAPEAEKPRFRERARSLQIPEQDFVAYHSPQCPFTAKYVPLLAAAAAKRRVPFQAVRFESAEQAQAAPMPFTAFGLFYNGAFVTHEIPSEKRFDALLSERGL